jgi:hypothetical protein
MTAVDDRPITSCAPAHRFSMPETSSGAPQFDAAGLSGQVGDFAAELVRDIFARMAPLDTPFGEGVGVLAYFSQANDFRQFVLTLSKFIARYGEQSAPACNGRFTADDPDDDGDCPGPAWCARCAWKEFIWHTQDNATPEVSDAYARIHAGIWEYTGIESGSDGLGYDTWRNRLTGEHVHKRPRFAEEGPRAGRPGGAR